MELATHRVDDPNTLFDESKIAENEFLTLYQYVVFLKGAADLIPADIFTSDPFCLVSVGGLTRRSRVVKSTLSPVWNEKFLFVTEKPEHIMFRVMDQDDLTKNDPLGDFDFDTTELCSSPESKTPSGALVEKELKLQNVSRGVLKVGILCRVMTPVKTQKLLLECDRQLADANSRLEAQQQTCRILTQKNESLEAQIEEYKILGTKVRNLEKLIADKEKLVDSWEQKYSTLEQRLDRQNEQLKKAQRDLAEGDSSQIVISDQPYCIMCGNTCCIL